MAEAAIQGAGGPAFAAAAAMLACRALSKMLPCPTNDVVHLPDYICHDHAVAPCDLAQVAALEAALLPGHKTG